MKGKKAFASLIAGRLLQAAGVAVLLVVFSAILLRLIPGDPALTILGHKATPEARSALRAELGLEQSLPAQIVDAFKDLVGGGMGHSIVFEGSTVSDLVLPAIGVTLAVIGATLVISLLVGVPLGLIAGLTRRRSVDNAARFGFIALLAMPPFLAGLLLLLVVSLELGIAPAGGWAGSWPENFEYLWLPAVGLSAYLMPLVARTVRQAAREVGDEQFVDAAIARGLPAHAIVFRHILPNALLPVVAVIGFNAAALLSGAVVIEAVFALPGVGQVLLNAVLARDFPVVQGIALVTGIIVVLINLFTDFAYALIDPRVRAS